ncbi:Reverse transcriptase domain [Cinara cedri]|uniref:Reverse transcriptase domain n=1 Tax=Cinara cedri TaxID=506608 RepID=A0A5E4N8H1_9HEMI|nr:Reverse transcriptase domain [Cinara cedri]
MLKDYNTTLVYESCINKTIKTLSQDYSINKIWESIKESTRNAAYKTLRKIQWYQKMRKHKQLKNKINRDTKEARGKLLEDRLERKKANTKIRCINGNLLLDNEDVVCRWSQYIEILYQGNEIKCPNNTNNPDIKRTKKAILSLRLLIKKQLEFNKDIFIAFIGLEKAFDTALWADLFKTLKEVDVDYKDIRIISHIYKEKSAIIPVLDKSETAKTRKGVRQERSLSPILFIIYIGQYINEIKETQNWFDNRRRIDF